MIKRIKKWGNNLVVVFTKEDEEVYGLLEGDTIDLTDLFLVQVVTKKFRMT